MSLSRSFSQFANAATVKLDACQNTDYHREACSRYPVKSNAYLFDVLESEMVAWCGRVDVMMEGDGGGDIDNSSRVGRGRVGWEWTNE